MLRPRPDPTDFGTRVSTLPARNASSRRSFLDALLGVTDCSLVGTGTGLFEHLRLLILAMASAPAADHAHGTASMRHP